MTSPLALFGFGLLLSSVPLAIKAHRRLRVYEASKQWPTVAATMTRSFVREATDGDGTSYLPEFGYRYFVSGREYTSSLHTEGLPFPYTEDHARKMVQRFPVGSTVQVAVDPADPGHAILDTGPPSVWMVLRRASGVAFVAGAVIAWVETGLPG